MLSRSEILASLPQDPHVSVLIIGGGINGIGTFRDLALNGVDTLLLDRSDFCAGASSASSHMAHGGIRYLENGEFRLVREAVVERNRLLQNAPHVVKPLPTTIPIFKSYSGLFNAPLKFLHLLSRPSERGSIVIKIGLILYDAYTGASRTVPRHRFSSRAQSLARWKELNPHIVNTATYYDGAILQPERLAVELIADAEADHPGARALNYVNVVSAEADRVRIQDEITGISYEVKPRLVINAAGAWIDSANRELGLSTHFIGGTKGSHVVLDHPELREAIGEHEFFFENKDGRIVLIFPLYDRILIGTSDIPIDDPDTAAITPAEVDYFLEMVARVFPSIPVSREQIVFQYCGVRPLPVSRGAQTTGQISRDHEIQVVGGEWTGLNFAVYSLVGGKWTTFRAFAEQAADQALAALGKIRLRDTRSLPIGGGRGYPSSPEEIDRIVHGISAWTGLEPSRVRILFDRYGMRAEQVASFICRAQDAALDSLPSYSRREIEFLAEFEKVVRLDGLILRRSMLAMLGRLTKPALLEIAAVLADCLEWDHTRTETEIVRATDLLQDRHNVRL